MASPHLYTYHSHFYTHTHTLLYTHLHSVALKARSSPRVVEIFKILYDMPSDDDLVMQLQGLFWGFPPEHYPEGYIPPQPGWYIYIKTTHTHIHTHTPDITRRRSNKSYLLTMYLSNQKFTHTQKKTHTHTHTHTHTQAPTPPPQRTAASTTGHKCGCIATVGAAPPGPPDCNAHWC